MGEKLYDRDELASQPADGDFFHVVDASDITDSPEGTSKKILYSNLIPDASTTVEGKVELATDAETITGTDTVRAMTPSNLTAKIDTDGTLAGNLDTRIPSQKAVKTYVDTELSGVSSAWNEYSAVIPTMGTQTNELRKLVFAGTNLTSLLSEGMKIKLDQTAGNNTHSLDLEAGSSQYASKTDHSALSITGNITIEAWVNFESLHAGTIAAKWYQDGTLKSYGLFCNATGTLTFSYSGDGNNESAATSGLVISPEDIGHWVHVAVSVVVSTRVCSFYKDGVLISTVTGSGAQASIHDNTSTFAIGARDVQGTPDTFFDGKISEVRLWSTNRTQNQIQGSMFNNLVGNETNLNGYWKLSNSYTDVTSNGNNLTASGSPSFVTSFPEALVNGTKYGIIVSDPVFSTDTTVDVWTGKKYGIGSGTISNFYHSSMHFPFGYDKSISHPIRTKAVRSVSTQSITNAYTYTKVQLNGLVYDPNNDFDEVTNYRYTTPVSGFYHISGSVEYGSLSAGYIGMRIVRNGVTPLIMQQQGVSTISNNMAVGSNICYLESGDYIELETSHNGSGAAKNLEYVNNLTFLEVTFLYP